MRLTEHFTLEEFLRSETAAKRGIDNMPPAKSDIHDNLKKLANTLEKVRAIFGKPIHINSGYRCPALNTAVGGVSNSAHLKGYAADIRINGVAPKDVTRRIAESGIKFDQCIDEGTWTHLSMDPRMRQQAFKVKP